MKDASLTVQKNVQHHSQRYFSSRNMERFFTKLIFTKLMPKQLHSYHVTTAKVIMLD